MNHRYQHFDWDDDRGEIVRRKPMTHQTLRLIAYAIVTVCWALACLIVYIGA